MGYHCLYLKSLNRKSVESELIHVSRFCFTNLFILLASLYHLSSSSPYRKLNESVRVHPFIPHFFASNSRSFFSFFLFYVHENASCKQLILSILFFSYFFFLLFFFNQYLFTFSITDNQRYLDNRSVFFFFLLLIVVRLTMMVIIVR